MNEINKNIPKLRFPEFEEDWNSDRLGSIAMFSKGKSISKSDVVEDGATECIRYGELYTVYSEVISEIVSKTKLSLEPIELFVWKNKLLLFGNKYSDNEPVYETKEIMQILELKEHPFFMGTQFHPEFTSRPLKPNPIFLGFVKSVLNK